MATIKQIKDTAGNVHDILSTIGYGTCATAAATAAKVATISDTSWTLKVGSVIGIKYTYTNTASSVTLNVNSTGAKNIWYNNAKYTSTSSNICGYAGRVIYYMYDGTYWVWMNCGVLDGNSNTVPCIQIETAAATAAKTGTCTNYSLLAKSYAHANVRYSNTSKTDLTLDVNGKGAKPIYINGTASSASNYTLPAGTYIIYYDGTNYHFRTDGVLPNLPTYEPHLLVTYEELKDLRDSGKLIPGQQYRITDYVTTTSEADTQSAGHQFDIIVTALDENTLSEIASACINKLDTQIFVSCNLSAWKIWYCLDNNTDRFSWANEDEGKGVIYRMIDEFGNDCPYDFKNIKFLKDSNYYYTFSYYNGDIIKDASIYGFDSDHRVFNNVIKQYLNINGQHLNRILFIGDDGVGVWYNNTFGTNCSNNIFGDSCYGNIFGEHCYNNIFGFGFRNNTFGDSCYDNTFGDSCYNNTFGNNCISNTFANGCTSNIFDTNCYSNTLGEECNKNTFGNNCRNNIFGTYCDSNTFGTDCDSNEFGDECNSNIFGDGCCDNSFITNCCLNTFGNNCCGNTLGEECYSNTFGDDCFSNELIIDCDYNTFGNGCHENIFTEYCNNNKFDNDCYENEFGNECYSNHFGNGCHNNTFGDECHSNTLGNYCYNIVFVYYCYENTFGHDCYNNSFGEDCNYNSFGNNCYNNSFGNEFDANSFENNCYNNEFSDDCYANSFGNRCSSNNFGECYYYNSFGNNCCVNTLGDNCYNNSFGNSCCSNTLGNDCNSNTLGEDCNHITFGNASSVQSYYRNIIIDNGNKYIYLYAIKTRSSSNYYQNVRIGLGVNNSTTYKTIADSNDPGQTYETWYRPSNSQTINV